MMSTEKYENWLLQIDFQKWFGNRLGNEIWTPLCILGKQFATGRKSGDEDLFLWSFLIPLDQIEKELEQPGINIFDGYPITGEFYRNEELYYYSRYGLGEYEPIVFRRQFTTKPSYLEVSQELVHFFELFEDKTSGKYFLDAPDASSEENVLEVSEGEIRIKTHRLKQFLAFKQMGLVIFISKKHFFNTPIEGAFQVSRSVPICEKKNLEMNYRIWYLDWSDDPKYLTELFGKKVILGMPLEKTGISPFELEKKFESYQILFQGEIIEHSCDPSLLSDYFGKNPDAPNYLELVYFSKDVLSKYYSDSQRYSVEDGYIRIGQYILRADTNHPDYVIIFLGDLGTDIPNKVQKYWRSFNVLPEQSISLTNFRRAFLGEFADPEAPEYLFKNKYGNLLEDWKKRFGWNLLKPLNNQDHYRLSSLRIPLAENQQEFDLMVEQLAIILIDSLNSKEFKKLLIQAGKAEEIKGLRSIKKLEYVCKETGFLDFDKHISFLHELYALRSWGSSHRKGTKEYTEVVEFFKIDEKGVVVVFRELLERAIGFVEYFLSVSTQTDG